MSLLIIRVTIEFSGHTVEPKRGLCLPKGVLAHTLVHPEVFLLDVEDGEAGVELVVLHLPQQSSRVLVYFTSTLHKYKYYNSHFLQSNFLFC